MKIGRRTLLIGGGAGVGLVVAYSLWPRHLHSDLAAGRRENLFGDYLKIGRDGRITVAVPQAETGQGVWTALPQIAADELGAAWELVGVEPAPLGGAEYSNRLAMEGGWLDGLGRLRAWRIGAEAMRITAGSTSIRAFEQPLREAAAVARAMLIGAAAERWNVAERDCETADGFVINGNRTFSFGDLAEEAADRSPPSRPSFRTTSRSRLVGQPLQRLDGPAKSDGSMRFAADVRLPGMLFASARIAPPGGRLAAFDRRAALGSPGVRHVAAHDGWVAAVADSWWSAEQALKAADPRFQGEPSPAGIRSLYEDAMGSGDAHATFARGDYSGVVRGSRPLTATYWVSPSQHLGLEPLSATARMNGGRLEVWAGTQAPELARLLAARAAGLSANDVIVYPTAVGEPAGRAIEPDAIPIAVELARATGAPVQLSLSQNSSQNHDRLSPGALARMTALPGQGGITAAWQMRLATAAGLTSAIGRLAGDDGQESLGPAASDGGVPPYSIPNVRIEIVQARLPVATGYMRASPQREQCFATESFIDELARAAGMEPLAFRMSMLGGNPRLARCLEAAAQLAQWDGGGPGSTMGIACCSAFGSSIGLVANAVIGDDQRVKVNRLVASVDCGRIVNGGLVTQQVAAGLLWGLAQATVPEPEWVAGMPRARPIGSLGLVRLRDTPNITVKLMASNAPAGGISGLAPAVIAPAIANAIFAATGRRMRSLPFEPMAGQ